MTEFQELLVSHLPMLRLQALSLTRHKADAEDLLQSAVTSALAAHDSFCAGTNFKAWITRILRNRFLSNIRQRRFASDLDDVPESLLGRSGGQEDVLEIKELHRQMALLPPDQLAILLLITVDGVSYEAASEQLGVAVGTLKCRVFRARAQLQAGMAGEVRTGKRMQSKPVQKAAPEKPVMAPPPAFIPAPERRLIQIPVDYERRLIINTPRVPLGLASRFASERAMPYFDGMRSAASAPRQQAQP